jgi:peptidoglycan/LPS O-acetylase OafA/YrhL
MIVLEQGPPSAAEPPGAVSHRPSSRVPALDGRRGLRPDRHAPLARRGRLGPGRLRPQTIFFALSGYLATGSWIRIRQKQASGGFRTFWWRRARRLLPVSFLGIATAVLVTAATGTASMQRTIGGDVVSVLGYFSNIRFWRSDQSYGELFSEPSLLQHYWTLSIEEQAFFVLPLLLAGTALLFRHRHRSAAVAVAVLTVVCAGFPAVVEHTPDAVWYSSIVRFGEFCSGVALALWMADRTPQTTRSDRTMSIVGAVALAVIVVVMITIPRDAAWLYSGGMALVIIPTVACLAAAARSLGPASAVLGARPLVLLGRWTFSIYVLHWPLFWVLSGWRLGLDGWQLATVRLVAAVAVGSVAHVLVERPLMASGPVADLGSGFAGARSRRARFDRWLAALVPGGWWRTRPAALALVSVGVALAVVGTLVPVGEDDSSPLLDESNVEQDWIVTAGVQMFAPADGQITVSLYGGSTALTLGMGGATWLRESELIAPRPGVTPLGCGIVNEGKRLVGRDDATGEPRQLGPGRVCVDWPRLWERVAEIGESSVALVMVGVWDTGTFVIDGETLAVGDPRFDALIEANLARARAGFARAGVEQVQLATTPVVREGRGGRVWNERGLDDSHPDRVRRFNSLLQRFADRHDDVAVVDYAGWVASLDVEELRELFPDGVHATESSAPRIWEEFLAGAVAEQYLDRPGAGR